MKVDVMSDAAVPLTSTVAILSLETWFLKIAVPFEGKQFAGKSYSKPLLLCHSMLSDECEGKYGSFYLLKGFQGPALSQVVDYGYQFKSEHSHLMRQGFILLVAPQFKSEPMLAHYISTSLPVEPRA
ncbi:hypothetical protein CFP56_016468 [Quercus suber]|uniref:Uncharacterized protein n=1 Tax=Quercus suber TaxID=58331 RepID=A0AAW0M2L5_QUESU